MSLPLNFARSPLMGAGITGFGLCSYPGPAIGPFDIPLRRVLTLAFGVRAIFTKADWAHAFPRYGHLSADCQRILWTGRN